ncbi:uncharacterized protein ELE39_002993 [Cryptosporidium sp. chipmunk genotype I]|uniref:uncharacterized protein n=1 Tax=Cryptosporidium sp. chipmunk genotype I TaxID=1280935 RepID=UPI00351A2D2A|nr:hypothetical protein ELE39_002993 [Cryptosporidium sp. chipmunk genotype I]
MNKFSPFLFLLLLELLNVWRSLTLSSNSSSRQLIQSNYWNSHFPYVKSIRPGETTELETDLFKCNTKLRDEKTMRISWECTTKIQNVIWIPNRNTLNNKNKFLISFTDSLGTLYAFPYSQKKLLNLCTSTSIDIFGEFSEKGIAILPKNFKFLAINECINY